MGVFSGRKRTSLSCPLKTISSCQWSYFGSWVSDGWQFDTWFIESESALLFCSSLSFWKVGPLQTLREIFRCVCACQARECWDRLHSCEGSCYLFVYWCAAHSGRTEGKRSVGRVSARWWAHPSLPAPLSPVQGISRSWFIYFME